MAAVLAVAISTAQAQESTAPRLRQDGLPARIPEAFGGGEVVLELLVDAAGAVTRVERLRLTPPYTEAVAQSALSWRFEPATTVRDGRSMAIPAPVLVIALFRPASFYAGPSPGSPPQVRGLVSPQLPNPDSLVVPAYPPTATGSGIVLIEIEMTARAEPRGYRLLSPLSGFDSAALDVVRTWRFSPPRTVDVPETLFVYAVLGFRAPLGPATESPR
jgi:outer membrane biosynthesis protein TonB